MDFDSKFNVPGVPRSYVWTALGTIICLRVVFLVLYRLLFHPLAAYPGPIASKLSNIPMILSAAQGRATYARYDMHKFYGQVVRTGPNELCFADAASIKDIYGQSANPCPKAPFFYNGFTLTGTHSVFSTTDRDAHSRTRRLISHGFSQQGIVQFRGETIPIIEKFLDKIRAAPTPCDIYDLVHALFLDIISQLSFASSFDLLEDEVHQGARDIQTYFSISPVFGVFPLAKYLPFGVFRKAREARPRIIEFVQACLASFRQQLHHGTAENGLLKVMMETEDSDTGMKLSDEELIENAVLFIIAGSGTTASTMLYLVYELGKRPDMQARLESEIREAFPDQNVLPSYETATKLPYLNCVLQEVLRLRGPIPTVAPRISPGKIIGDRYVPAGVIVSNLAYTTQRDPVAFSHPDSFLPERWENPTPLMKTMHRPFSVGPRNCIGMHLARYQLLMAVCGIYQRFDIKIDSRMTDEMMVLRDQGVMDPVGKQLWITVNTRATVPIK